VIFIQGSESAALKYHALSPVSLMAGHRKLW
jgi:hypothetical protein